MGVFNSHSSTEVLSHQKSFQIF